MMFIDTHCHLDGEEFKIDRDAVIQRAREAGCQAIFLPAIDVASCHTVLDTCHQYPGYCYPMLGLHPEEVRDDWRDQLTAIKDILSTSSDVIAIGEVGLDYYWSREFQEEQLLAFEEQVRWAIELQLPLMIHCRRLAWRGVSLFYGQCSGSQSASTIRPFYAGHWRCTDIQEVASA